MSFDFGERLYALTGDNGLGKSFVLDLVWWTLTGTWANRPAEPNGPSPTIRHTTVSLGPVVYLGTERITVFDPCRNDSSGWYPEVFRFGWSEIFDGIAHQDRVVCNGLVRDWVTWMRSRPEQRVNDESVPFEILEKALLVLSPGAGEMLEAGAPRRVHGDSREIPTLRNPLGGEDTLVLFAAAGFRRILALAYLLVWTWIEHWQASRIKCLQPAQQLFLLVDELELHLHPRWQRRILPALIEVVQQLAPAMNVQIFCTTHSPLVLASLETLVDESRDRLVNFGLRDNTVVADELAWIKRGDASGWLASEVFHTPPYGSVPAEQAVRWAEDFMVGELDALPQQFRTRVALVAELRRVLAARDRFWVRWFP